MIGLETRWGFAILKATLVVTRNSRQCAMVDAKEVKELAKVVARVPKCTKLAKYRCAVIGAFEQAKFDREMKHAYHKTSDEMIAELKRNSLRNYHREVRDYYANPRNKQGDEYARMLMEEQMTPRNMYSATKGF